MCLKHDEVGAEFTDYVKLTHMIPEPVASAQFLSRVGIASKVETLPLSVYFGKVRTGKFSMALLGCGTLAGDFGLRTLVGTSNPDTGCGSWNCDRYRNPAVYKLVQSSLASVDPKAGEQAIDFVQIRKQLDP